MEITKISENSIKIRGKKTSLIVDPAPIGAKNSADAVIYLENGMQGASPKVENYRIIIESAGEYEVGGVKINGIPSSEGCLFTIIIDGLRVLLSTTKVLEKLQEKLEQHDVSILRVNSDFNPAHITSLESAAVLFFGAKAQEGAKTLGEEKVTKVEKYAVTADKLPVEMQIIVFK
ncbi:MAG TPA: hypothetical protein VLF68_01575 [Candidatus Saccharimonadales bacterium]|nr:hypothetical protein [Candidatus Saccharimonadales bacterium]